MPVYNKTVSREHHLEYDNVLDHVIVYRLTTKTDATIEAKVKEGVTSLTALNQFKHTMAEQLNEYTNSYVAMLATPEFIELDLLGLRAGGAARYTTYYGNPET